MKQLLPFVVFVFAAFISSAQNPVLYGLTSSGGAYGWGDIFKITSSGKLTDLHDFGDSTDGQSPFGSLMMASNGLLYGMTQYGGAYGFGVIFSYNIATGVEMDVHDFNADTNGYEPYSTRFIQVGDSLLYGLTMEGGDYDGGTIISYNIYTGVTTRLYSFGIPPNQLDGYHPYSSLLLASDGLLYGTTQYGGVNGIGVIFTYNISTGAETKVHDFGTGTDGAWPVGAIIQAKNGLLYGTASGGGVDSAGIIFSYNVAADTENDVYDFKGGADGAQPFGALVQAGNGLLYGMTSGGGAYDTSMFSGGTIFSYNTLSGAETVLHSFGNNGDGAWPNGSLIQARDSLLYGMTLTGGADSGGIVLNYNISTGAETVLNSFSGYNGAAPSGDLLEIDSLGPYYPMFGYHHTWYDGVFVVVVSPRSSQYDNLTYTILDAWGDTIINNKQYFKAKPYGSAYGSQDTTYNAFDTTFYFREDAATRQVWILTNHDSSEKLLYDFSLQKGDSVYLNFDFQDTSVSFYDKTGWYHVDSVTTVTIYAGPRKALFLSNPLNKPDSVYVGDDLVPKKLELEWIEQIGSPIVTDYLQRDIFGGFSNFYNEPYPYYYITLCSFNDSGKLYHNKALDSLGYFSSGSDSCEIEAGINQLSASPAQVTLYPNPTGGEITIASTKPINTVTVTNLLGQVVLKSPSENLGENQFTFELKDEGMYFVTVTAGDEVYTTKIIVSK